MRPTQLKARMLRYLRSQLRTRATTQRALATAASCSQPHLANIVAGTRSLGDDHLEELLDELHITGLDLYDQDERDQLHAWIDGHHQNAACERPRLRLILPTETMMDRPARAMHRGRAARAAASSWLPPAA